VKGGLGKEGERVKERALGVRTRLAAWDRAQSWKQGEER
jgi:hypothetical protein